MFCEESEEAIILLHPDKLIHNNILVDDGKQMRKVHLISQGSRAIFLDNPTFQNLALRAYM